MPEFKKKTALGLRDLPENGQWNMRAVVKGLSFYMLKLIDIEGIQCRDRKSVV